MGQQKGELVEKPLAVRRQPVHEGFGPRADGNFSVGDPIQEARLSGKSKDRDEK
jgi:hypothetical protein